MFKNTLAALIVSAGLFSVSAHAGFVKTDVSTSGGGGAVVHQETGIEWLNAKYTLGMSVTQALATYAGWRLPTEDEVIAMAKEMFRLGTSYYASFPIANDGMTRYTNSGYSSCTGSRLCAVHQQIVGAFGITQSYSDKDGPSQIFNAIYLDEDNKVANLTSSLLYNNYYRDIRVNQLVSNDINWYSATAAVFLVSDGGLTWSSKNDPLLNVNNPSSPVNNPVEPDEPTHDVNGPASASIFALTLFAVLLRLRRRS